MVNVKIMFSIVFFGKDRVPLLKIFFEMLRLKLKLEMDSRNAGMYLSTVTTHQELMRV